MAAAIAPVGLCGGALGAARTNGIRRGATSARALGFKGGEGMGQSASLARRQVARVGPKVAGRGGAVRVVHSYVSFLGCFACYVDPSHCWSRWSQRES